jgi:hypothetical protein
MKDKFNTELCTNDMTFQDCELAILRHAVDESQKQSSTKIANDEEIQKMISIVEDFLKKKKCICYGGLAINNILPKQAQFYDRSVEIPDYDFYSSNAMSDAKELADIYFKEGFKEIEAKAGVHFGTYKVYVNFIPIADITYLHPDLFKNIGEEAILVEGIRYAPANLLRLNMFLELSRPAGDTSRWEKVHKRLTLLNKHYPLKVKDCNSVEFQRKLDSYQDKAEEIYFTLRNILTEQDSIFLGGYGTKLFSKYLPKNKNNIIKKVPDFEVITKDAEVVATIVIEQLQNIGIKAEKTIHKEIGELIPKHIEIHSKDETLAFIYYPIGCHSYNVLKIGDVSVKVATIDTMLNFYLAFYYSGLEYQPKTRVLCMSKFLFDVQEKNRLQQKGLLKRFSITCDGEQPTLESIRGEKLKKFKDLKGKQGTKEYDLWFLKYGYSEGKPLKTKKQTNKKKVVSTKTKKKQKSKSILKNIQTFFK